MKFLLVLLFIPISAIAFIPKPITILTKATENAGNGVYIIEQEVSFTSAGEPLILKEVWTVESSEKMKLVVTGTKDLKDKLRWVFAYDNGFRFQSLPTGKVSKKLDLEFVERYFHIRKAPDYQHLITESRAAPADLFNKGTFHPSKEPNFVSDPSLHLARVGGVVTYAFGKTTDTAAESPAAFFFEQDVFTLRKFRIGQLEVSADNYSLFAKGLQFPRLRSIKWGENTAMIQTLLVTPRAEKSIHLAIENSTPFEAAEFGLSKNAVEEFYKRFR